MPREPNQKWMARIYLPFQLELQVAEESTTLSFYLSHSHFDKPIGLMVFYWGFHQVHFDVGLYLLNLLFKGYQGGFTVRLKDYLIKTSIIQNSPKPRDCERIRPFSRGERSPKISWSCGTSPQCSEGSPHPQPGPGSYRSSPGSAWATAFLAHQVP